MGSLRSRLDGVLERLGDRASDRLHEGTPVRLRLEYPATAESRPRYGWGRPPHPGLLRQLAAGDARYLEVMRSFAAYLDDLAAIDLEGIESAEPCWQNEWLPGLDTVALYSFVRSRRPARYLEIGSGQSTKVVARAKRDGALDTYLLSVDPSPRTTIDALCDEIVRAPAELVDIDALVAPLQAGDVVFFDGSHRLLPNSDCVAFFLDLLPAIPPGVLVGIHDVYLPHDYPDGFFQLWWSEQYALAAMLLAECPWLEVTLPAFYASEQVALAAPLAPLWERPGLDHVLRHGSAFWLTTLSR